MNRGDLILSSAIVAIASLGACGGGGGNPDAQLVHEVDAGPPDAPPPPDAFVCTMTSCPDGTCDDLTNDPLHCGACDNPCAAGQVCNNMVCECPTYDFVPATLGGNPTGQDMMLSQLAPTLVGITPYFAAEIDAFGVGFDSTDGATQIGIPYTLDGATLPNPPFAVAAYNIDINTFTPEAAFAAVSGTVTFTAACDTGVSGTLTDVTFQAATFNLPPEVDPNGCTFHVDALSFSIADPASCPPPPPPT